MVHEPVPGLCRNRQLHGRPVFGERGRSAPLLRETAKRGLIYFDDSSSPRSVASQIAGANSAPFVKADITLDAVPTQAGIDGALSRLEALARERGVAVGFASALPVSIERLSQWVKAAESRGIMLVPISMVAAKPKQTLSETRGRSRTGSASLVLHPPICRLRSDS